MYLTCEITRLLPICTRIMAYPKKLLTTLKICYVYNGKIEPRTHCPQIQLDSNLIAEILGPLSFQPSTLLRLGTKHKIRVHTLRILAMYEAKSVNILTYQKFESRFLCEIGLKRFGNTKKCLHKSTRISYHTFSLNTQFSLCKRGVIFWLHTQLVSLIKQCIQFLFQRLHIYLHS